MAIWALFMFLGEFSDFATALYHSAVNFITLGYGDIVMSKRAPVAGRGRVKTHSSPTLNQRIETG
jgi:Ion channel